MKKQTLIELHTASVMMAAEELFEKKGFNSTSIDDIAYCTGISKSTLYVYFKSKQVIWDSIVCKYMEQLLETAEAAAEAKGSFEDRYYMLCFDIAGKFEEHPLFYKATLGTISMDMGQEIYRKIYETGEKINETVAEFIRSGIEEGTVRKDLDIYPAVIMMWSSISGIISMAVDKEEYLKARFNMSRQDYLKNAFKMLLEGFV